MQTQGMKKSQVMRIFIFQGLLVGIIGSLLGTLLGLVVASNLNSFIAGLNLMGMVSLPILFDYGQIALILLLTIALTLLSTLYPAYRAAKIEPADALRYE